MLGFDPRAARATWTVVLVGTALYVCYAIRETLVIFTIAILLAYLLTPLVNLIDRRMPTRSRTPALAIAYLLLVGFAVLFGAEVGTRVADQASALAAKAPEWLSKWEQQPSNSSLPRPVRSIKDRFQGALRAQLKQHENDIISRLPTAGLKVLSIAPKLIFLIVVPILSFFLLKDGRKIRDHLIELFDEGPQRQLLKEVLADLHVLLLQYMRALLFLSAAVFITFSIFFSILGLPYGILLATVAFLFEFIPLAGPLSAAGIILLVAGFSGFSHMFALVIFLAAYRIVQDYVLSPHLMSTGVEVHPLLVIFGVFAGGEVGGIAGIFLSVPVLATLRVVYRRIRAARTREELSALSA